MHSGSLFDLTSVYQVKPYPKEKKLSCQRIYFTK